MKPHVELLTVDLPVLKCLSCGYKLYPAGTEFGRTGEVLLPETLILHRKKGNRTTPTQYESETLGTEAELLNQGDALGWRKWKLYRDFYICPACRQKHPRTRPEWERRLTEQEATEPE